jgi:hypothetical protein
MTKTTINIQDSTLRLSAHGPRVSGGVNISRGTSQDTYEYQLYLPFDNVAEMQAFVTELLEQVQRVSLGE